ncbi:MAG: hypothetical protein AAGE80_04845 [Pseudomonadota bacterium]
MKDQTKEPQEISDADLTETRGALLLPAVQAAREAARRSQKTTSKQLATAASPTGFKLG